MRQYRTIPRKMVKIGLQVPPIPGKGSTKNGLGGGRDAANAANGYTREQLAVNKAGTLCC